MLGKIRSDDYSSRVEGYGNVADRLFFEYREYEEGMVERVAKCAEDTQNYYNEQEKEK